MAFIMVKNLEMKSHYEQGINTLQEDTFYYKIKLHTVLNIFTTTNFLFYPFFYFIKIY